LAYAGVKRLNLEHLVTDLLVEEIILPAAAQGAIAVEVRCNDKNVAAICSKLMDKDTWVEVSAERSFLLNIQGGCQVPVACRATLWPDDKLRVKGLVASLDGQQVLQHEEIGLASQAQELGKKLADYLFSHGADNIIKEFIK
jgi:hydroxymethylbilane synthase